MSLRVQCGCKRGGSPHPVASVGYELPGQFIGLSADDSTKSTCAHLPPSGFRMPPPAPHPPSYRFFAGCLLGENVIPARAPSPEHTRPVVVEASPVLRVGGLPLRIPTPSAPSTHPLARLTWSRMRPLGGEEARLENEPWGPWGV